MISQAPRGRPGERGQTLVIFALVGTLLFGLVGLAIESARLFILSVQALRAAEAGALSGVIYLPNYYNTVSPDGQDAVMRACAAATQHQIAPCPAPSGQPGATPALVQASPYQLQVTVSLTANLFFLALVAPGLSGATISRTATAEYLPPLPLGSRQPTLGDQATQHFFAHHQGPLELKELGDAYTQVWEEGLSNLAPFQVDPSWPCCGVPGPFHFNRFPTATWATTNHPQYQTGPIPNPDQHVAGYTGVNGKPGYNYRIVVPPGAAPVVVQLFSPTFAPGPSAPTGDSLGSACLDPTYNTTPTCPVTDQAGEYLQNTYSLYAAPLPFERSADVLLWWQAYPSLDLYPADLAKHRCGPTTAYDPVAGRCVPKPASLYAWTAIDTLTTPGTYRLVVETSGGYGGHSYAVRLQDPLGNLPPAGVTLSAWNELCVKFQTFGATSTFDLAEIPAAYAGRQLSVNLFDLGDAAGTVYVEILDPSGQAVPLPAWVSTVSGSGGTILDATNRIYNGLWLHLPIQLPTSYAPAPGQDWWQIRYLVSGLPNDTVTITAALLASPVHLVG